MDESYDSVSLSPTHLLARMQHLRLLQEAARTKLQQHRPNSSETTESVLELLSHFSTDSTSYRTFQNLLLDSNEEHYEASGSQSCEDSTCASHRSSAKIRSDELIEGVAVLNLSQESEFVLVSPSSGRSRASNKSHSKPQPETLTGNKPVKSNLKKLIELEDMPILSPRQDFETLLLEKIQRENVNKENTLSRESTNITKKPFLRRGEGLSRFGMKKDDLVIQNTKSLPWKNNKLNNIKATKPHPAIKSKTAKFCENQEEKITENSLKPLENLIESQTEPKSIPSQPHKNQPKVAFAVQSTRSDCVNEKGNDVKNKKKSPECKTKTWAAILTHEQDAFLRQLKQSSYYKNFESPAKSIISEASCNESFHQLQQERETAEQNIFELLENKVSNTSFCSESSFLQRFIMSKPDCSGNNTPMLLQKCLANNPQLLQLFPPPQPLKEREKTRAQVQQTVEESCESECSECDNETSSNTSTCCTCRTVEETNTSVQISVPLHGGDGIKDDKIYASKIEKNKSKKSDNLDQTVTATDVIKSDMAEMNSKLVATTELLKERLHELEDEIEMFRRENANLKKMREDIAAERHCFYEEKSAYEQKMNEDKVLSEYYLAEEKEKLSKQKQVYDRYVREIKGQLTRKEKTEVIRLKKEIEDLKEEFRQKDVKSTSCIARLRNQLKIIEKEKKDLKDNCEKLKIENRRIQQVNTNTRRLSNLKYLAEINKKLASIYTNDKMVRVIPDDDAKYKSSEIESKAMAQKLLPSMNRQLRARAKSVPNLTVTSRYAKYFSQRDAISQMERERVTKYLEDGNISVHSDNSSDIDYNTLRYYDRILSNRSNAEQKDGEMSYRSDSSLQTIKNKSQTEDQLDAPSTQSNNSHGIISDRESSNSLPTICNRGSTSNGSNKSKSPIPPLDLTRCGSSVTINQSKSPVSILSDRSSTGSRKSSHIPDMTFPGNDNDPANQNEDPCNRVSETETNLNPKELKRPDGSREFRFANGNIKIISGDGKTSKFIYYNGDIKETFYDEGKVKYYYAQTKTYHTTFVDGLEVLQFPDGQVEKRYADGSVEIRLRNGSVRYTDPRSEHVSEEWRFPDGAVLTVSRDGEQVVRFPNGQVEVHASDHKRREFPDGTVKLVYSDGTSETRYASGRVRIRDPQGKLIMDSATR